VLRGSGYLMSSVGREPPEMIHHRGTEGTEGTEEGDAVVSHEIIGAAVEVHRALGPGLLESSYQRCLCHELILRGVSFDREVPVSIDYKGLTIQAGYRIDLVVDDSVIVEVKATTTIEPIHKAQLLTYLKLTNHRVGLLINFNVERLVNGIRRIVNGYGPPP
jgi:GxxExxY protein